MNTMKARALTQFPTVLLTLISIIQALALELLWSQVVNADWLWDGTLQSLIGWGMVTAGFMGLLLIWLIYATMVMGFIWTPSLRDSILPFVIGIQQFMLVSMIDRQFSPIWLYVLASIFISGNWIMHTSLRRARQHAENALFFSQRKPATPRDFAPAMAIIVGLTAFGFAIQTSGSINLTLMALLLTNGILIYQITTLRRLWRDIMTMEEQFETPG